MIIDFHFKEIGMKLPHRETLGKFLLYLFKKEKTMVTSLSYVFCSDEYLLSLNNRFLKHDEYTDIITFNLALPTYPIDGDIYISIERARENARSFKVPVSQEVRRLIFHGALHLCGYEDKEPGDKRLMTQKENFYLVKYETFHVKHNIK